MYGLQEHLKHPSYLPCVRAGTGVETINQLTNHVTDLQVLQLL